MDERSENLAARKYFDRLSVSVSVVEYPSGRDSPGSPDEWILQVGRRGDGKDLVEIEELVEEFIKESGDLVDGRMISPYFRLDVSKKHFSWGADAVVIEVVVELSKWFVGGLAWDALKRLCGRLGGVVFDEPEGGPLTEGEALALVRGEIYRRHGISPDLLELESVDIASDDTARLVFFDQYGVEYDVRVHKLDGSSNILNICRKFPREG